VDKNELETVVQSLLERRKDVSREDLHGLVAAAHAAGGKVVSGSYEPGDNPCGTGIRFPWPHPKVWDFLNGVLGHGGHVIVFPLGTPKPDELMVTVNLRGMRG